MQPDSVEREKIEKLGAGAVALAYRHIHTNCPNWSDQRIALTILYATARDCGLLGVLLQDVMLLAEAAFDEGTRSRLLSS